MSRLSRPITPSTRVRELPVGSMALKVLSNISPIFSMASRVPRDTGSEPVDAGDRSKGASGRRAAAGVGVGFLGAVTPG